MGTNAALDMESLKEERSPTVEQVTASGDRVAELQETCPKRICTGISNHASVGTATPVVIVAKCSEAAAQISVPKPSSTQDTCALPWSSDHISNDVCAPSHVSSIKDGCCSETDDEPNESFGVDTTTSDPDVSRRRNLRRCRQDSENTFCCPVCKVTLRPGDFSSHVQLELAKLSKISSRCRKATIVDNTSPRKKAYERVRNNRMARQRARRSEEDDEHTTCPVCNEPINGSPVELNEHVDHCLNRVEQTDENEDVDIDQSDDEFEEYEWAGQTRVRASSLMPRDTAAGAASSSASSADDVVILNIEDDDCILYGDAQYSEADLLMLSDGCSEDQNRHILRNALISGNVGVARTQLDVHAKWSFNTTDTQLSSSGSSHETPTTDSACQSRCSTASSSPNTLIQSLKSKVVDLERQLKMTDIPRCLICMEVYTKPLTSIQCWHVHCEECWLHTLGTKKLCPQCNMITSASDLRRIYL